MTAQNFVFNRRTSVKNTSLTKRKYYNTSIGLSMVLAHFGMCTSGSLMKCDLTCFPLFLKAHLNSVLVIHALKQGCSVFKGCLSDIQPLFD